MKNSIRSNFDMLCAYEGQLWRLGALAERYFAKDSKSNLFNIQLQLVLAAFNDALWADDQKFA
jgi:type I restriction enzyme, R subunit